MDIRIDEKLVREVVAGAIMNSLSQEQRNTLITNAVAYLLGPGEERGYGRGRSPSPIEQAFNNAIDFEARKVAAEVLTDNADVQTKLRELITEAVESLMTKNREDTVNRIARAIGDGLGTDR